MYNIINITIFIISIILILLVLIISKYFSKIEKYISGNTIYAIKKPCPKGTYQDQLGQNECKIITGNRFSSWTGLTRDDSDKILDCPYGSLIKDEDPKDSIDRCEPDTYHIKYYDSSGNVIFDINNKYYKDPIDRLYKCKAGLIKTGSTELGDTCEVPQEYSDEMYYDGTDSGKNCSKGNSNEFQLMECDRYQNSVYNTMNDDVLSLTNTDIQCKTGIPSIKIEELVYNPDANIIIDRISNLYLQLKETLEIDKSIDNLDDKYYLNFNNDIIKNIIEDSNNYLKIPYNNLNSVKQIIKNYLEDYKSDNELLLRYFKDIKVYEREKQKATTKRYIYGFVDKCSLTCSNSQIYFNNSCLNCPNGMSEIECEKYYSEPKCKGSWAVLSASIYYFGRDYGGILGGVENKMYYKPELSLELSSLLKINIKDIVISTYLWIFITRDDKIFYKGVLPGPGQQFVDLTESNWTFDSAIKKIYISKNGNNIYVLTNSGSLYGLGYRNWGQLGNGTGDTTSSFSMIEDNVKDFAIGEQFFICVLNDEDETIRGAGYNHYKSLGRRHDNIYQSDGIQYVNKIATLNDFNSIKNIKQISCGAQHTLFLTNDGTLWGAGFNIDGQLAVSSNYREWKPTSIQEITYFKNLEITIKSIYTLGNQSFFITDYGRVWACGWNQYGELGTGSNEPSFFNPKQVQFPENIKITQISSTGYSTVFLTDSGDVYASGQKKILGICDESEWSEWSEYYNTPQKVNISNIKKIKTSYQRTVLLSNNYKINEQCDGSLLSVYSSSLYYFGKDYFGIGGNVNNKYYYKPELFPLLKNNIKDIVISNAIWIFITKDDKIFYKGVLPGPEQDSVDRTAVDLIESNWTFDDSGIKKICISKNGNNIYVLTHSGSLYGLGNRDKGQLGNGKENDIYEVQTNFSIIENNVKDFAIGDKEYFICVLNNGTIRGAGSNWARQLGTTFDNIKKSAEDVYVDYIATLNDFNSIKNIKQISCGANHTLFLTENGTLWGAGLNSLGQLAVDSNYRSNEPITIREITYFKNSEITIKSIYTQGNQSFFITDDDKVWACGWNAGSGQLGTASNDDTINVPENVQFPKNIKITQISSTNYSTVFLTDSGDVYASGSRIVLGRCDEGLAYSMTYNTPQKVNIRNIKKIGTSNERTVLLSK